MAVEVFVDESIRSGNYMLAAVTVEVGDLAAKRSALRKMLLPGERRMHLSKETVVRRRVLLDQIAREGFSVGVFSCRAPVTLARRALVDCVVIDAGQSLRRLVFESRSHDDIYDVRRLIELRRDGLLPPQAVYEHVLPHEEPLLWVADAVAWAWGAGKDSKRRIGPVVRSHIRVNP